MTQATAPAKTLTRWIPIGVPVLALIVFLVLLGLEAHPGLGLALVLAVVLIGTILVAVHHAEVIAHRLGEPLGSLVLAVAVTVIEVGLIVTMSAGGGEHASTLARDTVFSAIIITTTGIIGLSLLVGATKHRHVRFRQQGSGGALAAVATLAVLCLVLPDFTATPGPVFSPSQLAFAGVASFVIYALFVVTQTISHRALFLPVEGGATAAATTESGPTDADDHAERPSGRATVLSLVMLVVSLFSVVGLAELEAHPIEEGVSALGLPESVVGVIIALVILLPEGISAVRAALRDELQISLNLAYGSAMASIGLTIPVVAVASTWMPGHLTLGLGPMQIVLLAIAVVVNILTVSPGRATALQGGIHLAVFAAFLFLSVSP